MLSYIKNYIDILSNDKLLIGISIIFLNIASKYIDLKLTKNQEALIKNLGKEILVFFIAFIGTRDILISLVLTLIYWFLVTLLLNEDSSLCILPDHLKKLDKVIDLNNDGYISDDELNYALKILEKSKKQNIKDNQNKLWQNIGSTF
tara:strand:- start:2605 stop:3045 length:441 start_codon:yes stop_codon:yes gene_type:complete